MFTLPFKLLNKRRSARDLPLNVKSTKRLLSIIEFLLQEKAPFQRNGYPRAGGFDRLVIIICYEVAEKTVQISFYLPAPSGVQVNKIIVETTLRNFVVMEQCSLFNGLVLVGYRPQTGAVKYGEQNRHFAQIEQGAFLQALHVELCRQAIPNHFQGGLQLEQFPVQLPWDVEGITGLVV